MYELLCRCAICFLFFIVVTKRLARFLKPHYRVASGKAGCHIFRLLHCLSGLEFIISSFLAPHSSFLTSSTHQLINSSFLVPHSSTPHSSLLISSIPLFPQSYSAKNLSALPCASFTIKSALFRAVFSNFLAFLSASLLRFLAMV